MTSILLVGDRFAAIEALDGALTVSTFANLLEAKDSTIALPTRVVVGQGVSLDWLEYLRRRSAEHELQIEFCVDTPIHARTGRRLSHKHRRDNIIITDPVQVGHAEFRAHLVIGDENELMVDHATGMHIQGMVLKEAARQMFIAVTEEYYLPRGGSYYFVIESLASTFTRFAFPVATMVDSAITCIDNSRPDRLRATMKVVFSQCDTTVCEVEIAYMAILNSSIASRERAMAETAVVHACLENARGTVVTELLEGAV